jgi:hypothetical protein
MDQAHKMLQAEQKKVTIIQNNYYDTPSSEQPDNPAESEPGSEERIRQMRNRASARLPLHGNGDRNPRVVSDKEEKEMHKIQDEKGE